MVFSTKGDDDNAPPPPKSESEHRWSANLPLNRFFQFSTGAQKELSSWQQIPLLGGFASPFKIGIGVIQTIVGIAATLIFGVLAWFNPQKWEESATLSYSLTKAGIGSSLYGAVSLALFIPLGGFSGYLLESRFKKCNHPF